MISFIKPQISGLVFCQIHNSAIWGEFSHYVSFTSPQLAARETARAPPRAPEDAANATETGDVKAGTWAANNNPYKAITDIASV